MAVRSRKITDKIPEPTLRRLPWYLSNAKLMKEKGEKYVSSTQISRQINIDASQIAKDLSYVDISGRTRVGYEVDLLIQVLEDFLGFTNMHKAYLFGVGSLGGALLRDSGLSHFGLKIVGAFDINPNLVETTVEGIPIYHTDEFEQRMAKDGGENRGADRTHQHRTGHYRQDGGRRNQGCMEFYAVPYPCAGNHRGAEHVTVCPSGRDVQSFE